MIINTMMGSIIDEMVVLARVMKKNPEKRKKAMIISSILLLVSIVLALLSYYLLNSNEVVIIISAIVGIVSIIILISLLMSFIVDDRKTLNEVLEDLSEERNEIVKKSREDINVFDIVRLNLNQLNEYYTISKVQAKSSYRFSIIVISFGMLLIIGGVTYSIINKEIGFVTVLGTSAGAIAEFIGATTLILYKENNKSVNKFFSQLTYLQKIMLAIELTQELSEDAKRQEIGNIVSALINNG